ncbi:MAG: dihydroorotate dehydrogenase (quinone) [Methylocystis sp.]|nr:dihydroorotate dehydrogenase (quinone) [Methylocystis sp.]
MIGALGDFAMSMLRRLDPEDAHRATIAALRLTPPRTPARDDPRLAVRAFGLDFPNPVGVAAGLDKDAEVADALLALGFGCVEVGTLTPLAQPGNPRPRLFRLNEDRAVVNRYGFNNGGYAPALARLTKRRAPGIVGVNIGPNKDSSDRIADYVRGVEYFSDVASYFTINVSSPNTPGLRDLQEPAVLDELLARVLDARERATVPRPVLLKIAPDLSLAQLDDIVRAARKRRIDAMIVSLLALATRMLAATFLRVEGQFPLIGVGGVDCAAAAFAKIEAGASLVQLYTALVFEGPSLVARIKQGLAARLEMEKTSLAACVGRRAEFYARD